MRFYSVAAVAIALVMPLVAVAQVGESPAVPEVPQTDVIETPLAAPPTEEFSRGEVLEVLEEYQEEIGLEGTRPYMQTLRVQFTSGVKEGQEAQVQYGALSERQKVQAGQQLILVSLGEDTYVFDVYRIPSLGIIFAIFIGMAVVFAGIRGLSSLAGLLVSILVLAMYVVPQIVAGANPLVTSLVGAFVIAIVSLYLAHGFTRRTTVAVGSTLITIAIAVGLAQLFVSIAGLTGAGSEESYYLQTSPISFVNLKGLLLGGIIIGALGVLDDITTAQTAAVQEIWRANRKLSRRDLFKRGSSIGKEHITSLVNTLALAYVGASFPALLLFTVYQRPWWVVLNTETIAEEIIRTLVGSVALMVAVPITTLLAAWWFTRSGQDVDSSSPEAVPHVH